MKSKLMNKNTYNIKSDAQQILDPAKEVGTHYCCHINV